MKSPSRQAGFTLIEIMISMAILSLTLVAVYMAQGDSLRASGRAEDIRTASMLVRQKMTEKMLDLKKDMDQGKFPDEQVNDQGTFDEPFERYRWEFAVRKVEIPIIQNGDQAGAAPAAADGAAKEPGAANQAPADAQRNLAQMVTKKISESVREISTKVIWDDLGQEQSLVVTTHISKLQ